MLLHSATAAIFVHSSRVALQSHGTRSFFGLPLLDQSTDEDHRGQASKAQHSRNTEDKCPSYRSLFSPSFGDPTYYQRQARPSGYDVHDRRTSRHPFLLIHHGSFSARLRLALDWLPTAVGSRYVMQPAIVARSAHGFHLNEGLSSAWPRPAIGPWPLPPYAVRHRWMIVSPVKKKVVTLSGRVTATVAPDQRPRRCGPTYKPRCCDLVHPSTIFGYFQSTLYFSLFQASPLSFLLALSCSVCLPVV